MSHSETNKAFLSHKKFNFMLEIQFSKAKQLQKKIDWWSGTNRAKNQQTKGKNIMKNNDWTGKKNH